MTRAAKIRLLLLLLLPIAAWSVAPRPMDAGEPLSDPEWARLFRDLKRDLYGRSEKERAEAVRKIGEANCRKAASALVDFIRKPIARLIPLERRKKQVLDEIDRYMKLAANQGGGLLLSDIKKVERLQRELKEINATLARENATKQLAVRMLSRFTDEEALGWIMEETLTNRSWRVRLGLLEALAAIDRPEALATLKEALQEDDPGIRTRALMSLVSRGPGAGFEAALTHLTDAFWQVRVVAVEALGEFGDLRAVEPLIAALDREAGRIREDIGKALKKLTGKTLDPDHDLWRSWWSNEEHRGQAEEVCSARAKLWSDEDSERAEGVKAMAQLGSALGLPVALEAFREGEEAERRAALDAFRILREMDVVRELIEALRDEDDPLRDEIDRTLVTLTGCTRDNEKDADLWLEWWRENEEDVRKKLPPPAEGRPAKGKAPKTAVSFFGVPTYSANVMFILDVSGSMNVPVELPEGVSLAPPTGRDPLGSGPREATRLGLAGWELKKAVAGMPEEGRFNIIYYSDGAKVFSPRKMVRASKSGKRKAYAFVDHLKAVGGTNAFDALERAFTLADPRNEQKNLETSIDTIYFLSDGMPTVGEVVEPARILETIRERNALRKIVIHTICLLSRKGGKDPRENTGAMRKFMRSLAKENGGRYIEH